MLFLPLPEGTAERVLMTLPLLLPLGVAPSALPLRAAEPLGGALAVPAPEVAADAVAAPAVRDGAAEGSAAADLDASGDAVASLLAVPSLAVAPALLLPCADVVRVIAPLDETAPDTEAPSGVSVAGAEGRAARDVVATGETLTCGEALRVPCGVRVGDPLDDSGGEPVALNDPPPLPEATGDAEAAPEALREALALPLPFPLRGAVKDALGNDDALALGVQLRDAAGDRENAGETLSKGDAEAHGELPAERGGEPDRDTEGDAEALPDADAVAAGAEGDAKWGLPEPHPVAVAAIGSDRVVAALRVAQAE